MRYEHAELHLTSEVMDKLGFNETWSESMAYIHYYPIKFKTGEYFRLHFHAQCDDVYEGYSPYGPEYTGEYFWFNPNQQFKELEERVKELQYEDTMYFLSDFHEFVKLAFSKEAVEELEERIIKAGMKSYIRK